jgi:L-lactate dehydrogenase complex protein LldF
MDADNRGLKQRIARAAKDPSVEAKFRMVAERHGALRKLMVGGLANFEELREKLSDIKESVLADHQGLIARVSERVESLGGKVHLAKDAAEARSIIIGIAADAGVRIIVKGKSMTSEEAALTPALEKEGVEVFETDLGEYIIQLADERPSHIVVPAIHKTREEIARLFADKLDMEFSDDPAKLTMKAREVLRRKFLAADMGITGANTLVAENGAVVLLENEGNIRLSTTLPRIHVALAGIEKLIPSMADLAVFLTLLPRSATGQKLSNYVSVIRGPGRPDERDGAREFHLVLLDNGRSRMREDPVLRDALKCIRCGACANNCPVYQHVGGHAYGSVYPGPIGAMITHALATGEEGWLLPFASSLCGACDDVCPVMIPIHKILLELRRRAAGGAAGKSAWPEQPPMTASAERMLFRAWSELWSRPAGYRASAAAGAVAGRVIAGGEMIKKLPPPGGAWTHERDFPAPPSRPFRKRWQEMRLGPADDKIELKGTATPDPEGSGAAQPDQEQAARPRPGSVPGLEFGLKLMQSEVHIVEGAEQAKSKLKEVLSDHKGESLIRWDHPDLEMMELDELAREAGMDVVDAKDGDLKDAAASAAVGVTGVDFALAESGTIGLLTAPGRERSVSLLPPVHVALLPAERVLESLDDLLPFLDGLGIDDLRGITMINGPSMTGDIEMVPVFGVHGPGRLVVIIYGSS